MRIHLRLVLSAVLLLTALPIRPAAAEDDRDVGPPTVALEKGERFRHTVVGHTETTIVKPDGTSQTTLSDMTTTYDQAVLSPIRRSAGGNVRVTIGHTFGTVVIGAEEVTFDSSIPAAATGDARKDAWLKDVTAKVGFTFDVELTGQGKVTRVSGIDAWVAPRLKARLASLVAQNGGEALPPEEASVAAHDIEREIRAETMSSVVDGLTGNLIPISPEHERGWRPERTWDADSTLSSASLAFPVKTRFTVTRVTPEAVFVEGAVTTKLDQERGEPVRLTTFTGRTTMSLSRKDGLILEKTTTATVGLEFLDPDTGVATGATGTMNVTNTVHRAEVPAGD